MRTLLQFVCGCVLALIAGLTTISAAGAQGRNPDMPVSPPPLPAQVPPVDPKLPLIRGLTQVDSGPGILICDPIARTADKEAASFACGISRWLFLAAGGHGEFGRTMPWGTIEIARGALKRVGTRVPESEAAELVDFMGLTHIVLGEVTGDMKQFRLILRLKKGVKLAPEGASIILQGTPEVVLKAIPQAAKTLTQRIGIAQPRLPELLESTDDLKFLGGLDWNPGFEVRPLQALRLDTLGRTTTLGALMAGVHSGTTYQRASADQSWRGHGILQATSELERRLSDNPLALNASAFLHVRANLRRVPSDPYGPALKALAKYPNNFLLNSADHHTSNVLRDPVRSLESVQRMVRCNTASALSWSHLSAALSGTAQGIRFGRFAGAIRENEWKKLEPLYKQNLEISRKAVHLAPNAAIFWTGLSGAAIFAGEEVLARQAIDKAIRLDPGDVGAHLWALEIEEPKWGGNPKRWKALAQKAIAAPLRTDPDRVRLAIYLTVTDEPKLVASLLSSPALRERYRQASDENLIHYRLSANAAPGRTLEDAELPLKLQCVLGRIRQMSAHPGTARLAVASNSKFIHVYDISKQEPVLVQVLDGHTQPPVSLAWSPDGKQLASGGEDQALRIWEVAGGNELKQLPGITAPIRELAWSRSGVLVGRSEDGVLRLWDPSAGTTKGVLNDGRSPQGFPDPKATNMALAPDGQTLAVAVIRQSSGGTLLFWDLRSRGIVKEVELPRGLSTQVAWSRDGKYVAIAYRDGILRIVEPNAGAELRAFRSFTRDPNSLSWLKENYLAVGDMAGNIRIIDAQNGTTLRHLKSHRGNVTSLYWDGSFERLFSGSWDSFVLIWDKVALSPNSWPKSTEALQSIVAVPKPEALKISGVKERISFAGWTSDGRVVIQPDFQTVLVADPKDRSSRTLAWPDRNVVYGCAIAEGANQLILALSNRLEQRNLSNDQVKWSVPAPPPYFKLAATLNGETIAATLGSNGTPTLRLLSGRDGKVLHSIASQGEIETMRFSSDGTILAAGYGLTGRAGFIDLVEVATGKKLRILEGHTATVRALAFSADGARLVSGSDDGEARLWEVRTGRLLRKIDADREIVSGVYLTPDGHKLISSGFDGAVKEWDVDSGALIRTLAQNERSIFDMTISADGRSALLTVLSVGSDGAPLAIVRF